MDLKQEFLGALQGGADYDALLELVHRYEAQGLTATECYRVLEQIWLDFGYDKIEEGSGLQDNLEFVLEKVWYECPTAELRGETRAG